MTGKERILILSTVLLTALTAYAGPGERINNIKRDPLYIYGEATKLTVEDAYDGALNILQHNIQQWYEDNDKKNAGRIIRNMTFLADTISTMRGQYHRVFAYVVADKVTETLQKDMELEASMTKDGYNSSLKNTPLHPDSKTDTILRTLLEKTSFSNFATEVTQKRKEGSVTAASRDITLLTPDSYLAVFNKTKKGEPLLYLLKPGQNQRIDLISGQTIDTDILVHNRDSYRLIWFVLSP